MTSLNNKMAIWDRSYNKLSQKIYINLQKIFCILFCWPIDATGIFQVKPLFECRTENIIKACGCLPYYMAGKILFSIPDNILNWIMCNIKDFNFAADRFVPACPLEAYTCVAKIFGKITKSISRN